jgi:hypothetical protein
MTDQLAIAEFDPQYDAVGDDEVTDLLQGAVDLHVHPAPSPFTRRLGLLQAAQQASSAGFKALIVKSHHHSMVTDVLAVSDAVGGLPIPVYSGVALNNQVGGVNPAAVELALNMGGADRLVPDDLLRPAHLRAQRGAEVPPYRQAVPQGHGPAVLDEDGKVLPEVHDVLDLIKDADVILSGGHMGVEELDAVVRAAAAKGIDKMIISHPNFVIGAEPETCAEWVRFGVMFEHELCMYDDRSSFYHWELDTMLTYIKATGVENSLIGSDLGQAGNPFPVQAYRRTVRALLDRGVSHDDVRTLISTNPARLLGV